MKKAINNNSNNNNNDSNNNNNNNILKLVVEKRHIFLLFWNWNASYNIHEEQILLFKTKRWIYQIMDFLIQSQMKSKSSSKTEIEFKKKVAQTFFK